MNPRRPIIGVAALGLLLCSAAAPWPALAGSIAVRITEAGAPVADAVVYTEPADGSALPRAQDPVAVMDQRDKEFVPHVLPVLRGTTVRFPNSDNIRHHVYSFSEVRTFELRLYEGSGANPVEFEREGVAVLGCNIHDWMLGFVVVLDTPAFARSGADGRARIADLPAGRYRVQLWHPRLPDGTTPPVRTVEVGVDGAVDLDYALSLEEPVERRRGFAGGADDDAAEEFGRY